MKTIITAVLIIAGLYLLWYFMSRPSAAPSGVLGSPDRSFASGGVYLPEVVSSPEVELDHSDDGFMFIPVDSSGNVVSQQFATHVMKIQNLGDCGYNYRNYVILRIKPKVEPEPEPEA